MDPQAKLHCWKQSKQGKEISQETSGLLLTNSNHWRYLITVVIEPRDWRVSYSHLRGAWKLLMLKLLKGKQLATSLHVRKCHYRCLSIFFSFFFSVNQSCFVQWVLRHYVLLNSGDSSTWSNSRQPWVSTYSQLLQVPSLLMGVCPEHHDCWLLPKLLTELVVWFFSRKPIV